MSRQCEREVTRMIEGKGLGNKKVNRVNISLTNKESAKLNRLATACNMRPTTLAGMLVERCLNDVNIINEIQSEYCTYSAYRIVVLKIGNEVKYITGGREDL
ncbi:hypothetical protein HHO41_04875 [Bacillus sp. DNRA2]|uniref:hypothetical protein n=1 Tax=Bacillus sp. DNRA2 TaxID=2723053 RepID=UPI00145CAC1F|nr:hypothetical protein [Bacillus sp. DNRA2]NMD69614.1 hypothetical protein [Bacillus sp. DNRA2]